MDGRDFAALAARLAGGLDEVRACLLLSRDGLTLGVHPSDGESRARAAWEHLAGAGDPERGFLVVGDEVWAAARRGPYVGVIVATADALPGLLLDRLDQVLRAAERDRERDGVFAQAEEPEQLDVPQGLRSPLHPIPEPELLMSASPEGLLVPEPIVMGEATRIHPASEAGEAPPQLEEIEREPAHSAVDGPAEEPQAAELPKRRRTLRKKRVKRRTRSRQTIDETLTNEAATTGRREEPEVDPVALAREFAGLWGERQDRGR
ncbi:MAG: hypothetical protein ACRDH6_06575 [Actinomycetota bacterium]